MRGGHIVVDRSVVGATPMPVLATSLDGIELRITQDEETHMPLMRPFAAAAAPRCEETTMQSEIRLVEAGAMGRVAYARVAPNEDLVLSIEKLCAAEGFRHAFVRGALGSLVDACFVAPDGGTRQVRGPGRRDREPGRRGAPAGRRLAARGHHRHRRRHRRPRARRPVRRRRQSRLRHLRGHARRVAARRPT